MIQRYKIISIIYGGDKGKKYAEELSKKIIKKAEAKDKRYPIQAEIINESILTEELLGRVMSLFKNSEACVAFLTEEDYFNTESGMKTRVRQNVIFELGMALIELGRERCILLSDFDYKDSRFELPSDMNSLGIKQFSEENTDKLLDELIEKILGFGKKPINYANLLTREEYVIDYEDIFIDRTNKLDSEKKDFLSNTLSHWIEECESLPHFDEKCIYLLERIGFLPIFGKSPHVATFMDKAKVLIQNYDETDVGYYEDDKELLNFTKDLVQRIIEYTALKTEDLDSNKALSEYESLKDKFGKYEFPGRYAASLKSAELNPLIKVAYYDYFGLIYLRIYTYASYNSDKYENYNEYKKYKENSLEKAKEYFEKACELAPSIDMSLQIWMGFINYNLARIYTEFGNTDKAKEYFIIAIGIREAWLGCSNYNVAIRNALSYEYFIAKISYIDMLRNSGSIKPAKAQIEYNIVEEKLNTYSNTDDELNQLPYIRKLLNERKNCDRLSIIQNIGEKGSGQ